MKDARDRMADTPENRAVGAFVTATRRSLGLRQQDFAVLLGERLGVPVSDAALSWWEHGGRTVPGPVLAVVLDLAGRPLSGDASALAGEVAQSRGDIARLTGLVENLRSRLDPGEPQSPPGDGRKGSRARSRR